MRGGLPRSDFPLPLVEEVEGMSALMRKVGLEFGVEDIADALWLASQMGDLITSNQDTQKDDATGREAIDVREVSSEDADTGDDEADSADLVLPPIGSNEGDTAQSVGGIPFKTPAAPALRIRLDLARSLRPLRRTVPSLGRMRFDEAATVEQIADQGIWSPVLKPEPERWLEVALVVERTAATPLWKETIAELQTLLERQGAFRRVTTWRLASNSATVGSSSSVNDVLGLYAGWQEDATLSRQRPRTARELLDPAGRRLILLLSDCTSESWHDGAILDWLQVWAQRAPAAVMQLLPERLWSQSSLSKGVPVWLRGIDPGQTSDSLTLRHRLPVFEQLAQTMSGGSRHRLKLPVVTLAAEPMKQWAKVVAGMGNAWTVGMQFELKDKQEDSPDLSADLQAKETLSPEERVQQFRSTASLMAQRLAGLMSAAPVSPEVVNLIRQTLLPKAEPTHVAEVFMSGLVQTTAIRGDTCSLSSLEYEFRPNVRTLLADSVSIPETESVLDTISAYISDQLGLNTRSFEALLSIDFRSNQKAQEMLVPFARVSTQVLKQMGGAYSVLAERLQAISRITLLSRTTGSYELSQKKTDSVVREAREIFNPSVLNKLGLLQSREQLLVELFEVLNSGRNLSLVGEPGVGKTTILTAITRLAPASLVSKRQPVYLSLLSIEDEDDFYAALCESIGITACKGSVLARALDSKRVLLLLDEVGKLTWDGFSHAIRSQLRGLAGGSDAPLQLVLASPSPLDILFPNSRNVSPLSNICVEISIPPLKSELPTRKILRLAAKSNASSRVQFERKISKFDEGLERTRHRSEFEISTRWAVRPRDLQRALFEESPQVVHFIGHGTKNSGLYFEDETGKSRPISPSALSSLFKLFEQRESVECVLLSECYTETQAHAIAEHVPYVLGTRPGINDKAAVAFYVGFYDALASGESVEFAFEFGKSAVALSGFDNEDAPILIARGIEWVDETKDTPNNVNAAIPESSLPSSQINQPNLSEISIAIVGGHETTYHKVTGELVKYGLKRCVHIPPRSADNLSKIREKIRDCDLIVIVTSHVDHYVSNIVKHLKDRMLLSGEVIRVATRGKSGLVREVINYFSTVPADSEENIKTAPFSKTVSDIEEPVQSPSLQDSVTLTLEPKDESPLIESSRNSNPKYSVLYDAVEQTLQAKASDSQGLWISLQRSLAQYNLSSSYTPEFILNEALLRGIKAIDSGRDISSPIPWIRKTCRFVIQELSRQQRKERQVESVGTLSSPSNHEEGSSESAVFLKHGKVRQMLSQLPQIDQDILMLKVVQELRWADVQEKLVEMGHGEHSTAALSQRKRRALLRLRQQSDGDVELR